MMRAFHVPKEWVLITDPELQWMAMIVAREGRILSNFLGLRGWESGGVELFTCTPGKMACVQNSLAGYVDGRRFVVVWNPQDPLQVPEVYHDARREK